MVAGRAEFYDSALLFLFCFHLISSNTNTNREHNDTANKMIDRPGSDTLKRSCKKESEKIPTNKRNATDKNKTAVLFFKIAKKKR